MRKTIPAICLGVFIGAAPCLAGQATFQLLTTGDAPDVTVDEFGRTLVLALDGTSVWLYEDGGYTFIGTASPSGANGISADGTTIAGTVLSASGDVLGEEAARWTTFGMERLGWLPNALNCPSVSNGYAASADGSVVVGLSWDGCSGRGFRWTEEGGMVELANQGNGNCRASAVTDDGSFIAGFAQGSFSRTPATWNADGTVGSDFPFDMDVQGEIMGMTSDGSILAGQYWTEGVPSDYLMPFYWTQNDGIVILPAVAGFDGGFITDLSEDGRTLVGSSGTILTGRTAAIWRAEWGGVDLKTKLNELGANVPDGFSPQVTRGITDDGQTIVGWGILAPDQPDELAQLKGFIATIPPAETLPCTPDLNGDDNVGFADLTQLLNAWGVCPGCDEDLDDSGQVGFADLTLMLNAWGPCP